jgi:hypothetical protein
VFLQLSFRVHGVEVEGDGTGLHGLELKEIDAINAGVLAKLLILLDQLLAPLARGDKLLLAFL